MLYYEALDLFIKVHGLQIVQKVFEEQKCLSLKPIEVHVNGKLIPHLPVGLCAQAQEGTPCTLSNTKWLPVQKPTVWDWIRKTTALIPTYLQMGRLGPELDSKKWLQESAENAKGGFGVLATAL